jgi:hypothetical protein
MVDEALRGLLSPHAELSARAYRLAAVIAATAFIAGPLLAGGRPDIAALTGAPPGELAAAAGRLFIASSAPLWMLMCVTGARLRRLGRSPWLAWVPLYMFSAATAVSSMHGALAGLAPAAAEAGLLMLIGVLITLAFPEDA